MAAVAYSDHRLGDAPRTSEREGSAIYLQQSVRCLILTTAASDPRFFLVRAAAVIRSERIEIVGFAHQWKEFIPFGATDDPLPVDERALPRILSTDR